MRGKYLIFKSSEFDLEYPVLLPCVEHFVNHSEIKVKDDEVVSAGFFSISGNDIFVSGKSISLNLTHRKEDANIIKEFLEK